MNSDSAASPPVSAAAATAGRSPPSIAARRTVAAGTPAALATASAITPASAPCRSSPPSSRRRNVCSASVAAANRSATQPRPAGLRALARDRADLGERGVDGGDRQRRLLRGRRQRPQRRPADADLALRQLAGQPGHDDGDQPRVAVLAGPGEQIGDAGDLGQPRRGGADVGRRGGDVDQQHTLTLARGSDIPIRSGSLCDRSHGRLA